MKRSIEWAAGLFEGEGCIHIAQNHGVNGKTNSVLCQLHLGMTDLDVITDFADTLGHKVYGPYTQKAHPTWKPKYAVRVSRAAEVRRILLLLLPHLGSRRAYKALNALDVIECDLRPENTDISRL